MEGTTEGRADDSLASVLPDALRPERRDAAEHRQRILAEARRLFSERGVEAVSMHQIAQAAGVGQGTLYRRYANKGDLCLDLLKESGMRSWTEIEAYLRESAASESPLARLDGLIVRIAEVVEQKARLLGAIGDAFCGDRRAMQFRNPFYRWMHNKVATLLTEAVDRGEIVPLDATYTADALLAALSVDLYEFQRHDRGLSQDQIVDGLRRIYIQGLRAPCQPST